MIDFALDWSGWSLEIWSAVHYLWIGSCNYHLYEREFFKLAKLSAYAACGNCAQYIRCSITFYRVFASYRTCMDCIWIVRIAVERNDDNWRPQGKE